MNHLNSFSYLFLLHLKPELYSAFSLMCKGLNKFGGFAFCPILLKSHCFLNRKWQWEKLPSVTMSEMSTFHPHGDNSSLLTFSSGNNLTPEFPPSQGLNTRNSQGSLGHWQVLTGAEQGMPSLSLLQEQWVWFRSRDTTLSHPCDFPASSLLHSVVQKRQFN